eukprot:gene1062-1150_t
MMKGLVQQVRVLPSKGSNRASLHVLRSIPELVSYRDAFPRSTKVGFVPTMGALHTGHISLMKRSKAECDITMSSIFVNGKQFSPGEDLDKYPRQLEADLRLLRDAKVDAVFVPDNSEMYPPKGSLCHVEPAAFSQILEGQARPEFFRGVATVVTKLFNIVQPTISYFGQKDISQCILLLKMVEDLNMRTKVQVCETLRAEDGLALSSRNAYLSDEERRVADVLYRALKAGKTFFESTAQPQGQSHQVSAEAVRDQVLAVLRSQPMVSKVEYISIASHDSMKELTQVEAGKGAVLSSAVRLGQVRLIDNLLLGPAEKEILRKVDV